MSFYVILPLLAVYGVQNNNNISVVYCCHGAFGLLRIEFSLAPERYLHGVQKFGPSVVHFCGAFKNINYHFCAYCQNTSDEKKIRLR